MRLRSPATSRHGSTGIAASVWVTESRSNTPARAHRRALGVSYHLDEYPYGWSTARPTWSGGVALGRAGMIEEQGGVDAFMLLR